MKRLLIVEDDYAIRDLLMLNLSRAGYEVNGAESAEKALEYFRADQESFDVALIDVMLPGMNGFELCDILRRENQNMGIIVLSAKTQEADKVTGLDIGADDYVTKPFSVNELIARVEAVFRRVSAVNRGNGKKEMKELKSGDYVLDYNTRLLVKAGRPLYLTQVEFQLMELFFENPDVTLDRDAILKKVWGDNYFGDIKIVDVNIRRLRMKVEDDPSNPRNILTVWGFGYRWTE